MSFSFESMNEFFDAEIPEKWMRCAYCGTPLTLDTRDDRVLLWCKEGCEDVRDERRVLSENSCA